MRIYVWGFALALLLSQSSVAQELSQQSLFNRCYVHLTGQAVPLGHALMAEVKSGKKTALAACSQILRKAQLSATGQLTNTADAEAKAVLNNFYSFHRTWFPSNFLDTISGYSSGEHNGTVDIYDATEPALSLTYSMFGAGQKYSDTLTRSTGVRAIRVENAAVKTRQGWVASHPGRFLSNNVNMQNSPFTFRDPTPKVTAISRNINKHISVLANNMPVLTVGDLVGVRPTTESFIVPNISLKPSGDRNTDKGVMATGLNYTYDFFKTQGGGVLGSPIYMLQYYGHGFNMKFNGSNKVARRWSQQNMQSFLCASLPALRESDIASFIDTKSVYAFRNSGSCVMCHATLDPMAYTARNVTMGAFDIIRPNQNGDVTMDANGVAIQPPAFFVRNALAITTYQPSKASITGWPSADVADFHLQQPSGRLYFRSATGALVDRSVANIAGLGKAMSETEDYYLCAAKRYFEFMTGIQVPLYDRTDPRNAELNQALSKEAITDRLFVEDLAKGLRSSQSVIQMVEDIMKSPYYSRENYR